MPRAAHHSKLAGSGRGQDPSGEVVSSVESLRALELSTALQLAALVESSDDAVIVLSLDGLIATWSDGAERLFGYPQREVVGQQATMLSPPDRREEASLLIGRILAGGAVERVETEYLAKDGSALTVSLVISPINGASGQLVGVAAIVRDRSAQSLAESAQSVAESAQSVAESAQSVAESAQSVAEGELQASDELYRSVVEALNDGIVLQDASGRIVTVNESAERVLGRAKGDLIGHSSLLGGGPDESLLGLIHEDGTPFLESEKPAIASLRSGQPQVGVVMGVERAGGSTSWLSINSRPLQHPDAEAPFAVVSSITDITSLRSTLEELLAARFEGLERLALAAEYRDDNTHRHTERVALLAVRIAGELDLGDEMLDTLRHAAPLHDVGKIGIPDHILLKPGRLTGEEFELMKTHTTIGARILGESDFTVLRMGREIALTHHERWDGSGYPSGLRGEEIPISGRIVAVADVFDAITHARPYKEALPAGHAIAEITGASDTQFDPRVLAAFTTLIPELPKTDELGPSPPH
jgi:putative two-component system response regulator